MPTRVRSYCKINLGLAIGPSRPDGFHGLTTLYQTLELHDLVTVSAERAGKTSIAITSNDRRVPLDSRNTAWKMVEKALERLNLFADVLIHIEKRLPIQGGLGGGSGNAVAALIGLERELGVALPGGERLRLAGEVGSDVPLFVLGGAVLGIGRGEQVVPVPDIPSVFCVVAVPEVGVSTPQAFRDWDALVAGTSGAKAPFHSGFGGGTAEAVPLTGQEASGGREAFGELISDEGTGGYRVADSGAGGREARGFGDAAGFQLTSSPKLDRLNELSLAYASLYAEPGTSGIIRGSNPGNQQGGSEQAQGSQVDDLAESTLLSLVRTGVENDFERVVFPAYPSLREIKRQLMGTSSGQESGQALFAALSGSGSALFGLYRSEEDAKAAQQRVQNAGVKALMTKTLPRGKYWTRMFAG
jgi:4-diphosphocytidyl-2-C-methyl-D-erythritol kinase